MAKYNKDLTFYKPKKDKTGCATQWQMSIKKDGSRFAFLEAAEQKEDEGGFHRFDWDNCLTVKMEIFDLGSVLSVLDRRQEKVKLYHQTENDNKMINVERNKEKGYYVLRVSQKTKDGKTKACQHAMTEDEVSVLSVAIRRMIEVLLGWK